MNFKIIIGFCLVCAVTACGPGPAKKTTSQAPTPAVSAAIAGPEHDSTGVIAAVEGATLTLDHEGAAGGGLAPGRSSFILYGDAAAEAPLAPGSRVAFTYRKGAAGLELTALKAR